MSEPDKDKGKWKPGTMELATLRRADAEQRKAEESAEWRKLAREFFDWLKTIFTKE